MMLLKRCHVALLALIGACWAVNTVNAVNAESIFEIHAEGQLEVKRNGETILHRDHFYAIEGKPFSVYDGYREDEVAGWQVHNLWYKQDIYNKVSYRREVAQNGREVELTVQYRVPAYYFEQPGKPEDIDSFYRVRIPKEELQGLRFQARLRTGGATEVVEGVWGEESEKRISGHKIVYLTTYRQDGSTVSYDFGPIGIASFNMHVAASAMPDSWWVRVEEDQLVFAIGRLKKTTYPHNGVYLGKIRISGDSFEDWTQRHLHHNYRYFMELFPIRQFSLGAGVLQGDWQKKDKKEISETEWLRREGKDLWLAVGKESFSQWNGYGWENAAGVNLKGDISKGVLHGWAEGAQSQDFRMTVSEPGVYIFTLRVGRVNRDVGPFTITANEEVAVKDLKVKQGQVQDITFSRYLDKDAVLSFSGNWAVSTIAVQPLVMKTEDFTFSRGMWLVEDVTTPTTLYQFERRPVPAEAALQRIILNPDFERVPSVREGRAQEADDPAVMWRWESAINALGPNNTGSFYEFETEEVINRRLDELQKTGVSTILMNGFLIRHAYPEEHERIKTTVALVTRLAHERGMKIIDHFDLTIVPNKSAAYQEFVENIEWAQKDIRSGQVTRGYCINNPHFRQNFINRITDYVETTNIDGLMLDEVCFHAPFYCACEHCRETFYHDTGLLMPVDETDPAMMNKKDRLWNSWLLWKTNIQADFCVAVLQEIQKIRPDFVWMRYGAPIVFSSNLPARWGARLEEGSRYSSFMGIETISNNIHATHRFNLVSGSILNGLFGDYVIPKFVLIYPVHQPVFAYAGWIMANMNGHLLWMTQGNRAIEMDSQRYLTWDQNLDIREVDSVADVAVFYSQGSRDFSQDVKRYEEESIGLMQQLDDLHVTYQVILERDVTLEALRPYSLVILPGVSAISDEHLELFKNYVAAGGKVLATGTFATEDEIGIPRSQWGLEKFLPVLYRGEVAKGASLVGKNSSAKPIKLSTPVLQAILKPGAQGVDQLAELTANGQKSVGILAARIGKGHFVWAAPSVGMENFEADGRHTRGWHYRENPQLLNEFQKLLLPLAGELSFRPIAIPQAVKVRVHRDKPAFGETTYVHLYNATGAVVRELGKLMTLTPPADPFPALSEDVIFEVKVAEGNYKAVLASPDYPQILNLAVKRVNDNTVRVTVPASALKAYALVRILPESKE